MPRSVLIFVVLALATPACGSGSQPASGLPDPTTTISPSTSTLQTAPTTTQVDAPEDPPDLTLFIAAVDAALENTTYVDAALTDPEVFIATGQLFCELLDSGLSHDAALGEHLDALAAAGDGSIRDEDAVAAGVVMGASLEVICPHHSS
jgi:hypothetical protein